jgi:hypothetical protein
MSKTDAYAFAQIDLDSPVFGPLGVNQMVHPEDWICGDLLFMH